MIKSAISRVVVGRMLDARKAREVNAEHVYNSASDDQDNLKTLKDEYHSAWNRRAKSEQRARSWAKGKGQRMEIRGNKILKRRLAIGAGVAAAGSLIGAGLLARHALKKRREAQKTAASLYAGTLPDWDRRRDMAAAGVGGAALGAAGTLAMIALLKRRQHALAAPKTQPSQ